MVETGSILAFRTWGSNFIRHTSLLLSSAKPSLHNRSGSLDEARRGDLPGSVRTQKKTWQGDRCWGMLVESNHFNHLHKE